MLGVKGGSPDDMLRSARNMLGMFDKAIQQLKDGGQETRNIVADFLDLMSKDCRQNTLTCGVVLKLFHMSFSQLDTLDANVALKEWARKFQEDLEQ